jgi:F-type H+-transporting ATPase subunit alpha
VAILYCGTHALMADLRVDQVIEFQNLFLDRMRASHQDLLEALGAGKMPDGAGEVIEREAAGVCGILTQKA